MSAGFDNQDWGAQAAVATMYGGGSDAALGLDDYDSEGVDVNDRGGLIELEGAYHMEVADAKIEDNVIDETPEHPRYIRKQIVVRLVALCSVQGQSPAGSVMWHRIDLPELLEKKLPTSGGKGNKFNFFLRTACDFLAGVGLFAKLKGPDGKAKYIDTATGTTKLQFSTVPERLKGRQFIGRPKKDEYNGKTSIKFIFGQGASELKDPQNHHVPINVEAAAAIGFVRQAVPGSNGAAPAAPANQQRKPAAAAAAPTAAAGSAPTATPPAAADDEFASL